MNCLSHGDLIWLDVESGIRIPIKALGFFIHVMQHILRTIRSICKILLATLRMAGSADC
jgi:hypothetical protein